jgi:hypothetical protein
MIARTDEVIQRATAAKSGASVKVKAPDEYSISAVNLKRSDWKFMRRVAEARSDRVGGRPSVSKVIESLIEKNRAELRTELTESAA